MTFSPLSRSWPRPACPAGLAPAGQDRNVGQLLGQAIGLGPDFARRLSASARSFITSRPGGGPWKPKGGRRGRIRDRLAAQRDQLLVRALRLRISALISASNLGARLRSSSRSGRGTPGRDRLCSLIINEVERGLVAAVERVIGLGVGVDRGLQEARRAEPPARRSTLAFAARRRRGQRPPGKPLPWRP